MPSYHLWPTFFSLSHLYRKVSDNPHAIFFHARQFISASSILPVTTRTTTLVSVPHTSFALRFSELQEVEAACREDDERRAERTIDWMTARINRRCAKWVQDVDKIGDRDAVRTPWWDELRRCAEGDFVPSKTEGWNHPVACASLAFY